MNIYNKLTEDLQDVVKFHLNKHLDIDYLKKISTKLYFSETCKLHVKKNINILIKNIRKLKIDSIDFKFKFPYKIIKEDGNFCLRHYHIVDYFNNKLHSITFPRSYERLNVLEC